MHDPRQPRKLRPQTLSALIVDSGNFSRNLLADILRSLDVSNLHNAHDEAEARHFLFDKPLDLVLVSWEETDALEALGFIRSIRRMPMDRTRRLPVLLITSSLTRQLVISGRDAGVDEFLSRPIAPAALRQRLEMVIETPRPFVDCPAYLGPCRRRKNPADYHGVKRRAGDRVEEPATPLVDAEEEAAKSPIRIALAALRQACDRLGPTRPDALIAALGHIRTAKEIATAHKDDALLSSLLAFESYVSVAAPAGQIEAKVMVTALGALEQLAALPLAYADARHSVALALGRAIQKKLAA
jgi:CheY-like chemotaxis protein